jgi:hypothetical protein
MGASYRPTNAIRPTPRPDLDWPTRLSPETENQSNDPSADTSGNFAWGSWDDINDQEVAIVGFRVPYTPNADMGAFASSSATSANSANSTINTVDLSEID